MSAFEGSRDPGLLGPLAGAVRRAVSRIEELEGELAAARARRDEVEVLLQKMTEGDESPSRMAQRLEVLEAENADLKRRLSEGRGAAERILARVRYLQDHG